MNRTDLRTLEECLHGIAGDIAKTPFHFPGPLKFRGSFLHIDLTEGNDFCKDCADRLRPVLETGRCKDDRGRPALPFENFDVESDTTRDCDLCGATLDYSLTDAGVCEEVADFTEHPPHLPLTRRDAFALARVLEQYPVFVGYNSGPDTPILEEYRTFLESVRDWIDRSPESTPAGPDA